MILAFWEREWFLILLTGIVGFAGYGGKTWIDKQKEKKKAKKEIKFSDGLKSVANLYDYMEQIKSLDSVGLVSLIEVSNNGSIPKAGSKIYGRLIETKIDNINSSNIRELFLNRYEEFLVDEHYINMVLEIDENQSLKHYDIDTIKNSILKTILIAEDIKALSFGHLYSDVDKWKHYIICIENLKELSVNETAKVQNFLSQMRLNFKVNR